MEFTKNAILSSYEAPDATVLISKNMIFTSLSDLNYTGEKKYDGMIACVKENNEHTFYQYHSAEDNWREMELLKIQ